ncbi:MAG: L,D-transpeptidase family protein [Acidobacteria bacterium]|nr:L,D-transpeptidase family protein [Acidobacteriota bacterium]
MTGFLTAFLSLIFVVFTASSINGQIKTPAEAKMPIPFESSTQAVVVITEDDSATKGKAFLFTRNSPKAKWMTSGDAFPVVIGRSGLAWDAEQAPKDRSDTKKEGDGKSPAGIFHLTFAFGSAEKPEKTRLSFIEVGPSTECVDDVASGHYNKIVDRMKVGNFDWKSSEKMLEIGEEYALGVFVGYNSYPVKKDAGSCIFLHVWKDAETPTSGCTAMSRENMERVLTWLDPEKNPYLVQMTAADHKAFAKKWNLPTIK